MVAGSIVFILGEGARPNVAMIRAYGWRGGCPASGVTDAGVGSGEWFGW